MPTKRTDNGKSRRSAHTSSRPSASRGSGLSGKPTASRGIAGKGSAGLGGKKGAMRSPKPQASPAPKPTHPTKNTIPAARRSAPKPTTRRASHAPKNTGNPIGNVLGGFAQGISDFASSFGNKNAQGGFSTSATSFKSSQTSGVPSFASQRTLESDPGKLNIEGGSTSGGTMLTRRNVVVGAAALGGVALVGGGVSMAIDHFEGSDDTVSYISVAEDAVTGVDDLKQVKAKNYVTESGTYHLDYGTLVFADNDSYACLLVPGKTSTPLNSIRAMSLSSGNTTKLVGKARGTKKGFDIVDARLSTKGLIWVEQNPYESSWRVYTATFSNGTLGKALRVDEGDSNWLVPSIAANGKRAFWQLCPNTEGEAASEPSVVRSASFGSKDHADLISSKRAFATRLSCVDEGVVCTPRAETTGTYYTLTLLDASTGEVADSMTLPSSMTPDQASYGRSGFSFGFTDTYSYGGGIANLGTYTPMREAVPYQYDNLPSWLRFGRTPSADPCWCGDWFCIKSTRGISGIHFAKKRYFAITPPSDTEDWGEYLVSTGTCKKIVGMSKITPSDGSDSYTLMRVFSTKSGKLGDAFTGK